MAELQAEPFTPGQREELAEAVTYWAVNHQFGGYRLFGFADAEPYSPLELAEALRVPDSQLAHQFFRMAEFGTEVVSFDELVARFRERGRTA